MSSVDDSEFGWVDERWPDGSHLRGLGQRITPSEAVRRGEAIALIPKALSGRAAEINKSIVSRLRWNPAYRAEIKRIKELIGRSMPFPGGSASAAAYEAWKEVSGRQGEVAYREATTFAAENPLDYVSPQALVSVMTQELAGESDPVAPDVGQIIYVNPVDAGDLVAPVGPRRILVDLTHASDADLIALVPRLAEVQSRLGYKKLRGRRHLDVEEQMQFVHERKTSPTGRGKMRTWYEVTRMFNERFGEEVAETTLAARYRTWRSTNGGEK